MPPIGFYKQRIALLQTDLNQLYKKKSMLGWFRFTAIAGGIAAAYFLLPYGIWYSIITGILMYKLLPQAAS